MSTPSPLIPQGTFQAQANKGASNVRIAVATIVAIHVVFFGGLLLQGCKRDTKTASTATETNAASNLSLPPLPVDTQYYTNAAHLPSDNAQMFTSAPPAAVDNFQSNASAAARDTLAPAGGLIPNPPGDGGAAAATATEYTVVRGDTYARIAARHGTTVNALRKANPGIDPARLRPGMKLQVPAGAAPTLSISSSQGSTNEAAAPAASGQVYVVKAGDTLTKVAKIHHTTVSKLRAANNLKTSGLKIGQKLKIPAGGESTNSTNMTL